MNIKQIRIEKGLSVPALSKLTGISRRTIQDLEKRGDCMFSIAAVLADALGVSLDDLRVKKEEC